LNEWLSSNIHTSKVSFYVGSSVALNSFQTQIATHMKTVDEVIRSSLHSEVPLINQVSEYIIQSGGKRLRPALVLLSAGLFGEPQSAHHQLAAIVEFIHTATLLHDDVVDESDMRRGKSTANHLFGNAASVLVGDFLYSRAFQMMVKLQNMRVMEILAEATNTISEGEVLQLLNVHNVGVSEQEYLKVIHFKTAKLFEAATRLGAVVSDATEQQEQALAEYGMRLGTAFQLIDDVLDLSGKPDVIGKKLGNDLAEGKPTLPLLYAMNHGAPAEAAMLRTVIEKGGLDQLPAVLSALESTQALAYVRDLAKKEADSACQALSIFAESGSKQSLIDLAIFAVNRQY
jgi:octaprenyl-diphosphate synthase